MVGNDAPEAKEKKSKKRTVVGFLRDVAVVLAVAGALLYGADSRLSGQLSKTEQNIKQYIDNRFFVLDNKIGNLAIALDYIARNKESYDQKTLDMLISNAYASKDYVDVSLMEVYEGGVKHIPMQLPTELDIKDVLVKKDEFYYPPNLLLSREQFAINVEKDIEQSGLSQAMGEKAKGQLDIYLKEVIKPNEHVLIRFKE